MKAELQLYCYDWGEDGFDLYGSWKSGGNSTALSFDLLPCASRYTAIDGTVHGGGDDCEWDFDKHREYMGTQFSIVALYNRGTF